MTVPRSYDSFGNSARTHLLNWLHSLSLWASVVPETDIHRNLHLLNQSKVNQLSLWLSTILINEVKPFARVSLESLWECSLGISSHCLDWVVDKTTDVVELIFEVFLITLSDDLRISIPVGPANNPDLVFHKEIPSILLIEICQICGSGRCARSPQGRDANILIIPFRNETHTSESLSCTLRMANHSNFLHASTPLYLLD